jgi:hypothetical protein
MGQCVMAWSAWRAPAAIGRGRQRHFDMGKRGVSRDDESHHICERAYALTVTGFHPRCVGRPLQLGCLFWREAGLLLASDRHSLRRRNMATATCRAKLPPSRQEKRSNRLLVPFELGAVRHRCAGKRVDVRPNWKEQPARPTGLRHE